ncbi:MAG TPA: hypothetical protein VLA52_14620 [Thermohalobaculum sp.]|nr:hypothetical protein [Thermohalobaculum sp.]
MASFKKAPGSENAQDGGGFLPGLDPVMVDRIVTTTSLYWPTALGVAVTALLLLKGYRRSAPVAVFAAAILQGIRLELFW